jgi:hypothetical protein
LLKQAGDESLSHHPAADNPKYCLDHSLTCDSHVLSSVMTIAQGGPQS